MVQQTETQRRLTAQEFATRTALGTQQSLAASQSEVVRETPTVKQLQAQKEHPRLSLG